MIEISSQYSISTRKFPWKIPHENRQGQGKLISLECLLLILRVFICIQWNGKSYNKKLKMHSIFQITGIYSTIIFCLQLLTKYLKIRYYRILRIKMYCKFCILWNSFLQIICSISLPSIWAQILLGSIAQFVNTKGQKCLDFFVSQIQIHT